ncbi:long-chain-fatty-acid-CoA ligase [Catenaria anguillulae PL171]|uniref:Long-chain-fatty-acid--CoA ligase n=1 Tax=Catenaria anguillulae PL171 TaxID=765915 RepID=A0A1Y2HGY1_9FUNG|nr:long-chain-fatty-acid-CoA ligase [Catenaria anguillulae PL171]
MTKDTPFVPNKINLRKQSVPVPGTARAGSTPAYRNALTADKLVEGSPINGQPRTLYEAFYNTARAHPEYFCLGHRQKTGPATWAPYTWQTYGQVATRATHFGSGLMRIMDDIVVPAVGMPKTAAPGSRRAFHHLGLYSVNRPEWLIADIGCHSYSAVSVSLYDTLGPEALQFIINHAELRVVVCSADKLVNLIRVREQCPDLKVIISMDPLDSEASTYLKLWAAEKHLTIMSFAEVEDLGKTAPLKHMPPLKTDLATINYTSGTTGDPKGVMLTHGNLAAQNVLPYFGEAISNDDTHISYLPLAHIFERSVIMQSLSGGAKVGFFRGDVNLLIEDIAELRPTVFPSVPRLLNRIYARVRAATVDAPGVRGVLFRRAVADKLARLESGGGYTHAFWDALLFSKVQKVLGGRLRLMITGSAPLGKDVMQFLRVCFSTEILEGYGQTENGAGATIQLPGEYVAGQVGAPFPSCEVKLESVPEMSYTVNDKPFPRGEICIRGPNVSIGYWKDPVKTKETFDSEGWVHTGDIGLITDRGTFVIIDRKKNIFKLAQGEYVAPEKVENILVLCPLVAQVFVHGDSLQSELVCVAVPNEETFIPWARTQLNKPATMDLKQLCADPEVVEAFLHELTVIGKEKKLRGFEFVKAVYLEPEQFTIENNLLTPSFKLKRQDAMNKYRKQLDALYAKLAAEKTAASEGGALMSKAKL